MQQSATILLKLSQSYCSNDV